MGTSGLIDDSADNHPYLQTYLHRIGKTDLRFLFSYLILEFEISTLSMSQPWDYIAKLVCIGDSGTGKSSVSAIGL